MTYVTAPIHNYVRVLRVKSTRE